MEKIDDFEMVFVMNSGGSEHVLASEWQDQVSGIKGVDTGKGSHVYRRRRLTKKMFNVAIV